MRFTKITLLIFAAMIALSGCSRIKQIQQLSDKISGDKLYFCERYVTKEIGEGTKFKPGKITVMLKLNNPIGESEVDINVTDVASGKPVDTFPFTVQSSWDYIHFDDVDFKEKGKYKVSCIKKNGDVIATNEVEII
ncbi:MAG: hypothetical protein IT281_01190 [Ignavibacteria bacterium]|nr:hypothetical protein [Ignavibacteria bacterium]MCC7158135.1 hypothetical protein [Ignavibacteria bacterium]